MERYDIAIIGAGPAGLSAGLYAARALKKCVMIEQSAVGGLITKTDSIENYPGAPKDSDGFSITREMYRQAEEAGCGILYDTLKKVEKKGDTFLLTCEMETLEASSVIIASGSVPRKLGVKGEDTFTGKGVSYCATCDAMFFRGKKVAVSGGGDSAVKEADFLTRFASEVILFHRRDTLRATGIVKEKLLSNPKAKVVYDTVIEEITGERKVNGVITKNVKTGEISRTDLDGVFVFNGYEPVTGPYEGLVDTDTSGYIVTDERMRTKTPGLYAAGDIRTTPLRQVITACADGAVAATDAVSFLDGTKS